MLTDRRTRVSISGLMLIIAFVGAGLATIRIATEVLQGYSWCFTVGALLFAALRSRFDREERRDWWFGFLVFGTAALLLGCATGRLEGPLTWTNSMILSRMRSRGDFVATAQGSRDSVDLIYYEWAKHASVILIHVESLLVGVLGGFLAEWMGRKSRDRNVLGNPNSG